MILQREATFELDVPPSTNKLTANVPGVGRVKSKAYKVWIAGQLNALIAQRARPVQTPVSIIVHLPETSRLDLSNCIKPVEDLMVRACIIPNDSKRFVREVGAKWHDGRMLKVCVVSMVDEA